DSILVPGEGTSHVIEHHLVRVDEVARYPGPVAQEHSAISRLGVFDLHGTVIKQREDHVGATLYELLVHISSLASRSDVRLCHVASLAATGDRRRDSRCDGVAQNCPP